MSNYHTVLAFPIDFPVKFHGFHGFPPGGVRMPTMPPGPQSPRAAADDFGGRRATGQSAQSGGGRHGASLVGWSKWERGPRG